MDKDKKSGAKHVAREVARGFSWTYQIKRPLREIGESSGNIRRDWNEIKRIKEERKQQAKAAHEALSGLSASEKFETVFKINRWTDEALKKQIKAVHRTRVGLLTMAALVTLVFFYILMVAPLWTLLVFFPIALLSPGILIGISLRYAWHEWQLVNRKTIPFSVFVKMGFGTILSPGLFDPLPNAAVDTRAAKASVQGLDVDAIEREVAEMERKKSASESADNAFSS